MTSGKVKEGATTLRVRGEGGSREWREMGGGRKGRAQEERPERKRNV